MNNLEFLVPFLYLSGILIILNYFRQVSSDISVSFTTNKAFIISFAVFFSLFFTGFSRHFLFLFILLCLSSLLQVPKPCSRYLRKYSIFPVLILSILLYHGFISTIIRQSEPLSASFPLNLQLCLLAFSSVIFRLNGKTVSSNKPGGSRLIDVLRDEFSLTGTKEGCGTGACGSCSVLLDGRAVNSCQISLDRLSGHEITTIEGLKDYPLTEAIHTALKKASAPQCGFCTPAMIIRMYALLSSNPSPDRSDVAKALKPVLCRCTGYEQYVEAALLASKIMMDEQIDDDFSIINISQGEITGKSSRLLYVGHPAVRRHIDDIMTGNALFTDDYRQKDMIYGAVVASPYPSALIRSIDSSGLKGKKGFIRVLTARDVPGKNNYGKMIRDREMLCSDRARMAGDPVAVVLAETEEQARSLALNLKVDYEILEPVLNVKDALLPDAPRIHPDGNLLAEQNVLKGDPDSFFTGNFPVMEGRYSTSRVEQCPIELESTISYWDNDILTVIAPTQHVFFDRLNIARVLGLDSEKVRVIQPHVGGAFGKREDIHTQLFSALACYLTHRPAKVRFNRSESLAQTSKRHPFSIRIKTAYEPDTGRVLAHDISINADAGAYASWSKNILRKAAVHSCGPYETGHIRVKARAVYTNNPVSGAMRGFGAPQVAFAIESHMDRLAEACGITPAEIRSRNYLKKNSLTITGQKLLFDVPVQASLNAVMEKASGISIITSADRADDSFYYGTGIASCCYGIGFGAGIRDSGNAVIECTWDGIFELKTGVVDYGQGAGTISCQIAAEVLGIPLDSISIQQPDTHKTPNSGSTVASRQTFITGNAILLASRDLRDKMLGFAGKHLGIRPESLKFNNEGLISMDGSSGLSFKELHRLAAERGLELKGKGEFKGHEYTGMLDPETGQGKAYYPYTYGTQWAHVSVNSKTGEVKVLDMIACHYIGKAINPRFVKGQIYGSICMGIGYALKEKISLDHGRVREQSMNELHLIRADEMPKVHIILLEDGIFPGPFGAVGIGEPPLIPTAPAIANAIYDATGYRAGSLPVTPDKILNYLKKKNMAN